MREGSSDPRPVLKECGASAHQRRQRASKDLFSHLVGLVRACAVLQQSADGPRAAQAGAHARLQRGISVLESTGEMRETARDTLSAEGRMVLLSIGRMGG